MRDFTEIIDKYSRESIPLVKTLGIHVTEAVITDTEVRAVCSLPDRPEQRNHVGGPHAGAMFTAAESASGGVVQAAFADLFSQAVPLIMNGGMRFQALALGDIVATARMPIAEVARVRGELAEGKRPEFYIEVEVASAEAITGLLSTHWTLKPIKR
ncbi:MAG: DUF4442 domain-containing protein [Actinobacteria bacterium]|uniref:Unannotated protein n=1 Tax=freshwater metagenome TaxID=449393 RepID=A0A6J7FU72_9ZZZZ|nr:DUF4442 domain-containing protein [Actinomycetota bacterium]MSY26711.1 DUF4442 domain-containing protein [Actinomycetota bacterium]MSZ86140.1 DUF4442 domain-containing protein [Actinomycetota bacterium]